MNDLNVNQQPQTTESVDAFKLHNTKPQKTAQDWVRDMRMSAAVNKFNTGVETDQVTPDLLLATSKKLLGISKREQEPDPKDSLAFQRFYGPEMLFQERILRDGGKLARNILWKATNRGNLDFMPVGALDKHISSVFYDSKLAQMMDGSSPLETIDSAYKTTRIGEGGVASQDSAPDEMRTVQPSYFGFIDPVRCFAKGTEIKTESGWKAIEDVTTEDKTLVKTDDGYKYLPIKQTYKFSYSDTMIGYDDGVVGFLVTPHHRLYVKDGSDWRVDFAENLYGAEVAVNLSETDEDLHILDIDKWYRTKCDGTVYCVTVENEFIMTRFGSPNGLVILNSPESFRVGLDVYMTKNVMKGTDGKLYQKFIDAKTGKEVLLDSETAANSVIAAPEMRDAKTKSIFALGGPTGVRIVPKDSVQYYLPRADEAYSAASNLVTMLSGVKEMRLQMGCLHPDTNVLTIDKKNLITVQKAQVTKDGSIPGSTQSGLAAVYPIRTTVAKFPPKRNWFYKIVLRSGRSLITSADHRWSVLRNNRYRLIDAKDLKPGDMALRSTFKDVISRRTFVNGMLVNKDLATVFGYIARSLSQPDSYKMRISVPEARYNFVMQQLARIGFTEGFNTYYMNVGTFCIGIRDEKFKLFLKESFGTTDRERKIPDFIMSANAAIVSAFLDGYTNDPTKVGRDSADDIWILDIPNTAVRDSLAFLFARIETDTLYRDTTVDGEMEIAMKLVPMDPRYGDMILDEIKVIKKGISAPIMVDIDVNDNLYAVANGIVTHNSKYPLQAISVENREAPLVRGLDEASGKDMQTLIGKYLGARFAPRDGVVTAVRKDRIDVRYDDGRKGSIDMYVNFPMNAKGYINNTPRVKAGQAFKKGDCLASSNYTDDKGVAALGTNLRSAWMSWKGGTYEDAIVISESAAKKLTSTTMYKTAVDLDKTVKLGKQNYATWKPGEFSKEQMENLDANGIVKPGTILHKEDPMILAVRMTEPSPGTLGKRILTDMSERWEHDHPGVVTDVVKTRKGIKVYATVTAPAEVGDKLSGGYGNKGEISQILPDDEMPTTKKGEPIDILLSPLGLISRTNNSQIYEGLLGKVAAKTGKTITVPQFFDRPIPDFVAEQLKQNHIEPDEDLVDPSTGRVMPNITTGISYIYKLKHLAESKMSARGTSTYDAEGLPGGKGMDGCFPGPQLVMTSGSYKAISALAFSKDVNQVGTCTEKGEFCYYPSIDSFRKLVPPSDLISIVPKWSFGPKGFLAHTIIPMTPTKNHAIYMYNGMIQKHAGDIKSGDKLAGMGRRPSDDQLQVLANLISSTGMVDDDRLTVTYDDDHAALATFKCGILKGLHVHINEYRHTITVPHYSLYEAALQEQDFGELYKCLQLLDGHGADEDAETIAKYIPWSIIPESRGELKEAVKALQEKEPVKEFDTKTHFGLMPIVVDKIEPYKTNKELVRVYDLTIDTTHRYILFGGYVVSNSKRFGTLEQSAMAGHNAFDIIKDSKYIRGQSNSDFWRNLRTGDIPTIPGEPLVHKKFFAHLTGAGVNVKKTPQGVSIFALTNKDVNELAGPREVKSRDTYEARTFRPIDDGLFGQNVFGINGDKWGYIQLDEPVPNPVMEEPLARLLNIPEKKFADVASGKEEINGIKGGASMKAALEKIDLGAESAKALNNYKTMTPSGKDKALKRYVAIERMRRAGVKPSDYMLDKIPVIPPIYRPITSYNGLTMVADSNYLYAQLLDARDDARESKNLPQEFQDQARENIYTKWKELTGLYAPQDVKLQSKHVQGLLKWALGDSPKFSALQRKVLSATVDTVGRGVVVPDPRLRVNELGIPEAMAFNIMGPIVERKLVKQGYTPLQAMEKVKKHDIQARDALNEVMSDHPVLMNRAPTLHKLGVMAYKPRLVSGHAIHVNPSTVVPFNMDFDGNCVDFDSKIFLKISKSSHNIDDVSYVNSVPENNNAKETLSMKIPSDTKITAHDLDDNDYVCMKIGEFPRIGTPIKDKNGADCYAVPSGIQVLSCDPATGEECWQTVKMLTVENDCDTVKVKVGSREMIISTNESMAVFDHETGKLTKVAPDKAYKAMIPVFKKQPAPFGTYGDRDLGWMLGAFISDGWRGQRTIGYAKLEEAKRDEFVRIVRANHENFTVKTYAENTNGQSDAYKLGNSVKIHLNSETLVEWFDQWNFINEAVKDNEDGKRTALFKQVPRYLIDYGSEDFLWGLFTGLLDGDGTVVKNTHTGKPRWSIRFSTSSPYLRDDICQLCYRLGLRFSVTTTPPRGFSNEAYVVVPSTLDMFDHLDKLSCVGAREKELILEWMSCTKSTDMHDIIPISKEEFAILKTFINNKTDAGMYSALMNTKNTGCRVCRYKLLQHADEIKEAAPSLYERAMATNTIWETVSSVEPAGKRQVFDFEVEGTKVFAINNGVVIWDTVNIHAPVSDDARKEAYAKMMPERNLIGMRSREILYKPEKEYQQGLYIATRMKSGPDVRTHYFNTLEEAKQAYRDGIIDVDDPIVIKSK